MALTRITKGVIKPNESYDTHNIVSTGIVTSVGLDVNGSADISGSLSVGGVLTYEDVTSIDSVGLITARSGIVVSSGSSIGIGTDNLTYPLVIHDSDPRIQLVDTDLSNNRSVQLRNNQGSFVPSASQHTIFYSGGDERVRITSNGYLGINTNNPLNALEVLGKSGNTDTIAGVTVHEIARFNADTSEKLGLKLALDNTNKVFYFHRLDNGGDFAVSMRSGGQSLERLRITHEGVVGIGTNDPTGAQKLNVYADSNADGGIIQVTQDGTGDATIDFQLKGIREYSLGIDNDDDDKFKLSGTAGLGNDTILTATTSGSVGIGTNNPVQKLHAFGNVKIDGDSANTSSLDVDNKDALGSSEGDEQLLLNLRGDVANNGQLRFRNIRLSNGADWTTSTFRIQRRIDATDMGYIDFGTGSGSAGRNIQFGNGSGTMMMHLDNTGRVAIGTDSPNASLPLTIQGQYPGIQFRDNQGTSAFNINADANEFRIQTGDAGNSPTQRFVIRSDGRIEVTGDGHRNSNYGIFQVNQAADNDEGGIAILNDANNRSMRIYVDASGNSVINSGDGGVATLILNEGNGTVIVGDNLLPDADNDQDLGSSSKRWANIYTADLQLSNKGNTNDVDGTWGQYTIQEGEDDLFLINKRNGKKYKFMLEEVN
tara:strand:- start:1371 stop:3332 length:1962 start_codon:yes stop_codon:yes gene_type:complete